MFDMLWTLNDGPYKTIKRIILMAVYREHAKVIDFVVFAILSVYNKYIVKQCLDVRSKYILYHKC